jgi:hypothetical protein
VNSGIHSTPLRTNREIVTKLYRFNTLTLQRFNFAAASALLIVACAGSRHFHVPAEGPPRDAPLYVDLLAETQVATLHFPPGSYAFYALDDVGYYYRAPRKVIQHTGGGSVLRNGGIYVNKSDPKKIRGYIYLAGALTHVGDLSRTRHEFRD